MALHRQAGGKASLAWLHDDLGRTQLSVRDVPPDCVVVLSAPPAVTDTGSGTVASLDFGVPPAMTEQLLRDDPPIQWTPLLKPVRAWRCAMPKTGREFSPDFKREAVALLESSGRPLMQVATEVGISPSMLRKWRAMIRSGTARSRAATPAASSLPSLADQASEIARLRRELDRARMERDVLKRMARPVRKGSVKDGMVVCINVSGLKAKALTKMDISAQAGPHKSAGAGHHI